MLDLAVLLERETIPPFVYTYPPRSAYTPEQAPTNVLGVWSEDELLSTGSRDLNVYVHVPFCRYICNFCNLYTVVDTSEQRYDRYVASLLAEIAAYRPVLQARDVVTIFIGGGTPSLLGPLRLEHILNALEAASGQSLSDVTEVCVEATPDSLVAGSGTSTARQLVDIGITRVNMGVQSLDRSELLEAGRGAADAAVVTEAVAQLALAGIQNISTDLIIGFEGQTDQSWVGSVTRLLELEPHTISTYFLTVRPDANFARRGYPYVRTNPALYERYDLARELILRNGFTQESNVRYTRLELGQGYLQKVLHFAGKPTLGIGAGARSYNDVCDYLVGGGFPSNKVQIDEYMQETSLGRLSTTAGFWYDDDERIRKRLALDPTVPRERLAPYGYRPGDCERYENTIDQAKSLGLIAVSDTGALALTSLGLRHKDAISWSLFSERVLDADARFYAALHDRQPILVRRRQDGDEASGIRAG